MLASPTIVHVYSTHVIHKNGILHICSRVVCQRPWYGSRTLYPTPYKTSSTTSSSTTAATAAAGPTTRTPTPTCTRT